MLNIKEINIKDINFNNIVDYFIPKELNNVEGEKLRKATILIYVHLFFIIITLTSGLFSYFSNSATQLDFPLMIFMTIGGLFIFREHGMFVISGNIIAIIIALGLVPLSLTTGGLYSLDFLCLINVPLVAYLFANKKSGFIWSGLLLIYACSLYLLEINSDVSFREQTYVFGASYYFIGAVGIIFLVMGVVWIFEEGQVAMVAALKSNREKLENQKENLLQKEDHLKRSNAELEQYAKVVSHDLKEPLRNVDTYSRLLNMELKRHREAQLAVDDYLKNIKKNINNMNNLIKDLLEYSRLDVIGEEKYKDMNFSDLIYIVSQNLQQQFQENEVKLFVEPLPEMMNVVPVKVIQLFQNLISNAIKFRKKGVACRIDILVDKKETHWQFGIKDNGIGIQEDQQKKVFQLFHRLHSKQVYEGSGIGLATCKKIVELHKGNIWIESKPDVGSTFYFTLAN